MWSLEFCCMEFSMYSCLLGNIINMRKEALFNNNVFIRVQIRQYSSLAHWSSKHLMFNGLQFSTLKYDACYTDENTYTCTYETLLKLILWLYVSEYDFIWLSILQTHKQDQNFSLLTIGFKSFCWSEIHNIRHPTCKAKSTAISVCFMRISPHWKRRSSDTHSKVMQLHCISTTNLSLCFQSMIYIGTIY
jgi:hypothetical protein